MNYTEALNRAALRSREHACTVYVCAIITNPRFDSEIEPRITGYMLSDWTDGTVVAGFTNGVRFEL